MNTSGRADLQPEGIDDGAATGEGIQVLGRAHRPIREHSVVDVGYSTRRLLHRTVLHHDL